MVLMSKKIFVKSKRSTDKNITTIDRSITTTQSSFAVMVAGADSSRTFNGGIISGNFALVNAVANGHAIALLVVVKDGDIVNPINLNNSEQTYKPEENVLWGRMWRFTGKASGDPNPDSLHFMDTIKTKRILRNGDAIHFTVEGDIVNSGFFSAMLTHFYKL